MSHARSPEYLADLLRELRKAAKETEWLEFKVNNADPVEIGRNISALANAAALEGKASAYLVWGVENGTHDIVGTTFDPRAAKIGNEELENVSVRRTAC